MLLTACTNAKVHNNTFSRMWLGNIRGYRIPLEAPRHVFNNTFAIDEVPMGHTACFACTCSPDIDPTPKRFPGDTPSPAHTTPPWNGTGAEPSTTSSTSSTSTSSTSTSPETSSTTSSPEPEREFMFGQGLASNAADMEPATVLCESQSHMLDYSFEDYRLQDKYKLRIVANASDADRDLARMIYVRMNTKILPTGGLRGGLPEQLPSKTRVLRIPSVSLYNIDVKQLGRLRDLEVLDLSHNLLDPVPPSGVFEHGDLPRLNEFLLAGLDLARVTNDTFVGLKGTLQTLDVSRPARFPPNRILSFKGFGKLNSIVWWASDCPAGFFSVSDSRVCQEERQTV